MIEPAALDALADTRGPFVRVLVAAVRGSAPREAGAAMLVDPDWQEGTIGGGRLEWEAARTAREMLAGKDAPPIVRRQPLGPALGQCCGGAVTLVFERWPEAARGMQRIGKWQVRRVEGAAALPERLSRRLSASAPASMRPGVILEDGWLAEPAEACPVPVIIYGAGHVGLALARTLAPLPRLSVTLVDPRTERFEGVPELVTQVSDRTAEAVVREAPDDAWHYVMTPDHEADLALCHTLLGRDFAFAGLIGSATKWARFRSRLAQLGHAPEAIARITCPIGDPSLGREPQAIAISVAADLLARISARAFTKGAAA